MLFLRRKSDQEKLAESLSGEPPDYPIFMVIAKTVGKDHVKRDKHGREISRRERYHDFVKSTVVDFLPIVDDDLPEIARLYHEKYKDD